MKLKTFILSFVFVLSNAQADIGPKPQMDFQIIYKTKVPLSILEATLYQCEDRSCSQPVELKELGPQGFECIGVGTRKWNWGSGKENTCASMAYGYKPYQKLIIKFKDKTFESNIFKTKGMTSHYKIYVNETELQVD